MRRAVPVVVLLALAGCGGKSEQSEPPTTRTVERTTRVEVVRASATDDGAFDPEAIYRREAAGVVTVLTVFGGELGGGGGQGSGFVVDESGEIATNAHVVTDGQGADLGRADEVYVQFADRNKVPATVVGVDPHADVALLKVDPEGLDLHPLPFAPMSEVDVGEPVAAIGSPFGEEQSLSVGVVSALDRSIESLTGFAISGAIQTDAAINKGNSGGPLLDAQGRVLGINSQIRSSTGVGSGVGFAVNADTVRRSLAELREAGRVRYAFLGVTSTSVYPQLAEKFGLGVDHGAWVQEASPGGPAEQAGIRGGAGERERFQAGAYLRGGDVIVAVDGREVGQDLDLGRVLQHMAPGQEVEVEIFRDGRRQSVDVTLGERPSQPG